MAFTTATTSTNLEDKEIASEIPNYVRLYKDGTVYRPRQSPFVPPSLDDPQKRVSSKDIVISENPSISARLYLPKFTQPNEKAHTGNQKLPILVYFHGGGFVFESAFSKLYHTHFNLFLSQANVIVVSVEYRLAPEHSFPAAYEDCWAALKWVTTHSTENPANSEPWLINYGDFQRVFIGGDSAGGNIVHNIAMRAGFETLPGGVKILGAFLSHAFFYSSEPIGTEVAGEDQRFFSKLWNYVCPSAPGGINNPMINPAVAGAPSLAGLGCSKMLVCVAGKDKLRERGVWYYEAVKKSEWEGEVEFFEEEEDDHVYHIFNPETENAKKMMKRLASFILD